MKVEEWFLLYRFRWPLRVALASLTLPMLGLPTTPGVSFVTKPGPTAPTAAAAAVGAALFRKDFTPAEGLGPLFNKVSCAGCHATPTLGGMGPAGLGTATRIGRLTPAGFDPMIGSGGPIARAHSVSGGGPDCRIEAGIPLGVNVTSVRNAPDLRGTGIIENIPDEAIVAGAVPYPGGVHGRPHWVTLPNGTRRVGRFGWKADTANLRQFVADAFRTELGVTSSLAPVDLVPAHPASRRQCPGENQSPEIDDRAIEAVTAFVSSLPPLPARGPSPEGETLFRQLGCSSCHTSRLPHQGAYPALFSDLLLHDLGPALDDKVGQGEARGTEWRTTPLWGLGSRLRLLHDGRARTVSEAILAHGGEAATALERFLDLSPSEREALLEFLSTL